METSKLDRFIIQNFSQGLHAYDSENKELYLEYPETVHLFSQSKSKLNRLAKKRKSDRSFSHKQLSFQELGILLSSAYAWNGIEHRGYPSAGATYPVEIFCITFHTEKFCGNVLYYDPEKHGVACVHKNAPTWDEAKESLNIEIEGAPAILILITLFPERSLAKYGVRGGRFALLEAGAVLQQFSLQIAALKNMKGVIVGGVFDNHWLKILKLDHTNAQVAAGILVGK